MKDKQVIIETHYCSESDMTFITEEIITGKHHSLNTIGFYFGEPNSQCTEDAKYDYNDATWDE